MPYRTPQDAYANRIGEVVRERRMALGLTQSAVAALLPDRIHQSWLSQLELGKIRQPSRSRLEQLAAVLDVPASQLLAASGWNDIETYITELGVTRAEIIALDDRLAHRVVSLMGGLSRDSRGHLAAFAEFLAHEEGVAIPAPERRAPGKPRPQKRRIATVRAALQGA
jgi:transcriptional regulator with XRE-family HTH domain